MTVATISSPPSSPTASILHSLPLLLLLLVSAPALTCSSPPGLVLEEGYAVSTVFDGNKISDHFHPFSLHHSHSDGGRLVLLDSADSTFYTLSLPLSQDSEMNRLSGKGERGFSDGDPAIAMFDRPRNFAVDSRGNVYVADRGNYAIRKMTSSGMTTTIAGGYSNKTGRSDGPAQNATFSNDFELVFIPKMCALLISDRANRLIRQMDLKPEDCEHDSRSGLGKASVSLLAVFCVLLGSLLGFVARPFLVSCTGNLWRSQIQQDVEALPNQSSETSSDTLLRHQKRSC